MNGNGSVKNGLRSRIRFGLFVSIIGLLLYVLGVAPQMFNLDRSPIMGFVQIAVFLIGLAFICLGGYISLNALWVGREKNIAADIGFRLVSTGYVISVFSGMADVIGVGTQSFPEIPYFGIWQAIGVISGILIICLGFFLLIPFPHKKS